MNLSIHANTASGRAVYNLQRRSEDAFEVQVDWDKSQVSRGGFGLEFNQGGQLEVRDYGGGQEWDIHVGPQDHENSVFIMPPPSGFRGPGQTPPIGEVDFGAPIPKEQARRVALQVASSLIQVPFLDRLLDAPVPGSADESRSSGAPTVTGQDVNGVALSEEQKSGAATAATELAKMLKRPAEEVEVTGFAEKGMNAGNFGFPVQGELQISGFTEGIELKLSSGEEKFVFRGATGDLGRFGVDLEHDGFWKADARGIYTPDTNAGGFDDW